MKHLILLLVLFLNCNFTSINSACVEEKDGSCLLMERKTTDETTYFQANFIKDYHYEKEGMLIKGNYTDVGKTEIETLFLKRMKLVFSLI